jgi:hypothetical protein
MRIRQDIRDAAQAGMLEKSREFREKKEDLPGRSPNS